MLKQYKPLLVGAALVVLCSVSFLGLSGGLARRHEAKDAGGNPIAGPSSPTSQEPNARPRGSHLGTSLPAGPGGTLQVPEDTEALAGLEKTAGAPPESQVWTMRVVSWRRSSSGYSVILDSHHSRRNAWGEWETPKAGRTLLLPWDLWVKLERPNLVGAKVEAAGLPQLPRAGEAEAKAMRVTSLKILEASPRSAQANTSTEEAKP
jgi:hypothetical protein